MAEQLPVKQLVVGSSPTMAANGRGVRRALQFRVRVRSSICGQTLLKKPNSELVLKLKK